MRVWLGLGLTGAALLLPTILPAQTPPEARREAAIATWTYTVRAGDSFSVIARRMGVTVDTLAAANGMAPPYVLRVGQVLKRPDPAGLPKRTAAASSPPPPRKAAPPAARTPAKREAGAPRLLWPTSGAVTARFGAPVKGLANNGIDLAAFAGMTVHAAAAGKVVFAGTEPERFGQLIVIDHGKGWVTAYAYLGQVRVKEGQAVKARQIIARIGKSGEAKRPGLHFELRKGTAPRDPMRYLPIRL